MEVHRISVAETWNLPEFAELAQEYANECALAGLPDPAAKMEQYLLMEAAGPDIFHALGAFHEDKLVGLCVVLTNKLPHYGAAVGIVESLFVSPGARATGAGLALIRAAESLARAQGCPAILFSAPSGGRLEALMPRLGYRETNKVFMRSFHE